MDNKANLTLVTGGARSGKSGYAQKQALQLSDRPVYVATAKRYNDEDFKSRIRRHIADRDGRWTTLEEQLQLSALDLEKKVVVVDCVTLWLTNFFSLYKYDVEQSLHSIMEEINTMLQMDTTFIMITNELGMGVHAETEIGRKFTDLQGWANQFIAAKANKVVLMVSGIPLTIKSGL